MTQKEKDAIWILDAREAMKCLIHYEDEHILPSLLPVQVAASAADHADAMECEREHRLSERVKGGAKP
jgi:hypothetical protein